MVGSAGSDPTPDPTPVSATPTNNFLSVDGKAVSTAIYKIDGSNYFKLRDLGIALDFYVGYDNATRSVSIDTTKPCSN